MCIRDRYSATPLWPFSRAIIPIGIPHARRTLVSFVKRIRSLPNITSHFVTYVYYAHSLIDRPKCRYPKLFSPVFLNLFLPLKPIVLLLQAKVIYQSISTVTFCADQMMEFKTLFFRDLRRKARQFQDKT